VDWIQLDEVKGPVAGCCEHGNESLGSIKDREYLGQLIICQLLKKDSVL
jgi:hypothetical protein